MRAADPAAAAAGLRRRRPLPGGPGGAARAPRVKICGVTDAAGILAATRAGADAIGLNFAPGTPRELTLEEGAALARLARSSAAADRPAPRIVVVTADLPPDVLARVIAAVDPDEVQLNGDEPPSAIAAVGRPVSKALRVAPGRGRPTRWSAWPARSSTPAPSGSCSTRPADRTRAGPGSASTPRSPPPSPARCRSSSPAGSRPRPSARPCWPCPPSASTSRPARSRRASPGSGRARTRCGSRCSPSAPATPAAIGPTSPSGPTPVHPGLARGRRRGPLGQGARLRRALRARDARRRARGARGRLRRDPPRPPVLGGAGRAARAVRRPPHRPLPRGPPRGRGHGGGRRPARASTAARAPRRPDPAHPALPQARGPRPHRRPQDQQRARPGAAHAAAGQDAGHRRDRAPASTASRPPRPARCSGCRASCSWARRTSAARRPTCSGCARSARRSARHLAARPRSRTPSTRRCATGSRTSRRRTTSWAPRWARTRTRPSSATSSGGSATRRRPSSYPVEGRLPDLALACVGGGSNAIGLLARFIGEPSVRLAVAEAAGDGVATGRHAAAIVGGTPGILHGSRSLMLQDRDGQVVEAHSASAGLDYPGVGPQLAALAEAGRLEVGTATDREAIAAMKTVDPPRGDPARARDLARGRGAAQAARGPRGVRHAVPARRPWSSSGSPAAATRTSPPSSASPTSSRGTPSDEHDAAAAPHTNDTAGARRIAAAFARARGPRAAPRSSRTSSPGTRTRRRRSRRPARRSTTAPTCSRSACRTRTRSPTARRSSARRRGRSPPARRSTGRSPWWAGSPPRGRRSRSSRWATRTSSSAAATGGTGRGRWPPRAWPGSSSRTSRPTRAARSRPWPPRRGSPSSTSSRRRRRRPAARPSRRAPAASSTACRSSA